MYNLQRPLLLLKKISISHMNNLLGDYEPQSDSLEGNVSFEGFSHQVIANCFDRLSNKKSAGMDGLSGFFIKKKFKIILIPFLKDLFDKIIRSNSIPTLWKIAKMTPVHKKGSKNETYINGLE